MTKPSPSLYLVYGTDDYEVDRHARACVDRLCPPEEQTLGLEIIDGQADHSGDAVEKIRTTLQAARTVGLFGGRKVVWLKNANFFSDTVAGKAAATKEEIQHLTKEITSGFPEGHSLVISASKVDRRSAFFKACKSAAEVSEFSISEKSYEAEQDARDRAYRCFREEGRDIDEEAMELFLSRTGSDTRAIRLEAGKVITYLGDRKAVHAEDILEVVSASRESMPWDLTDALAERDAEGVLRLVRQLLFQKQSPIGLVVILQRYIQTLRVMRQCIDLGWVRSSSGGRHPRLSWADATEATAALEALGRDNPSKMHWFRAGKLYAHARAISLRELTHWLSALLRCHERMVSSQVPADVLLEATLLEVLGAAKEGVKSR